MNRTLVIASLWVALLVGDRSASADQLRFVAPVGGPEPVKTVGGKVVKEGRIQAVRGIGGTEPQLTDAKGKKWLLRGALEPELRNLHGHTVKVWGRLGKKRALSTFIVTRYTILSAGGRRPLVGRLRQGQSKQLYLQQKKQAVQIRGSKAFLRRLRRRVGCKIWIVGDLADGALKAFKYGVLTCKKETPIKPKGPKKEKAR